MAKDTFLNRKVTLNCKGKLVDLSSPTVMAILNVTPDSFYGNSRINNVDDALKTTEKFINEGATFIDVGAYSSRPGAVDISVDEELNRSIPIIKAIAKEFPETLISIDTFRAKVAEECIGAGAHLINDISGGSLDNEMFNTVAKLNVPYIMMHMKGTPQTMQIEPEYEDVALEVITYFTEKMSTLKKLGVKDVIIDPGFGFAKTIEHNYQLLNKLACLNTFNIPILVGFSRKSMITQALNIKNTDALNGTSILNTISLQKGATILRVHDVKAAVECIKLSEKVRLAYF